MTVGLVPCGAAEAIDRFRSMIGVDKPYRLGSGDYAPVQRPGGIDDSPWTTDVHGVIGCDCAGGAICYAYKLTRHRPGFNRNVAGKPRAIDLGPDAPTVVDDLNTNSAIEDAEYQASLFVVVPVGSPILPGDLLMYPTIQCEDKTFIGHVQMAIDANGAVVGDTYSGIAIGQVCGPEDRSPAFVFGKATAMDSHDTTWPKPQHRTRVIRPRSDIA